MGLGYGKVIKKLWEIVNSKVSFSMGNGRRVKS